MQAMEGSLSLGPTLGGDTPEERERGAKAGDDIETRRNSPRVAGQAEDGDSDGILASDYV